MDATPTETRSRLPVPREVLAAGITLVVVAGLVIAFLGMRPEGSDGVDSGLPPAAEALSPSAVAQVGGPAPRFVVPTLDGELFDLETAAGRPVWINVWASWCPPCRAEFPDIDEIRTERAADGLVFVAVNFGESLEDIDSYLANTGYDFPVAVDPLRDFEQKYNVQGLPMHIFIGADGRLESVRVGGMTRDEMEQLTLQLVTASTTAALDAVPGGTAND